MQLVPFHLELIHASLLCNETSAMNLNKEEVSLKNNTSSEYFINEDVSAKREITSDCEDERNVHGTHILCNMSIKVNSEVDLKIKVARKIKSGPDCSYKNLKTCGEQYIEEKTGSDDVLTNGKVTIVPLLQNSSNESNNNASPPEFHTETSYEIQAYELAQVTLLGMKLPIWLQIKKNF